MIVFSSDNGPEKSWKQRIGDFGHHSNGIYRGGKRDIYEGGHRVPFFVRWPNGIKAPNRTCDDLVGQVDLLATIAELVGAELSENAGEDSQSFYALLKDAATPHSRLPLINHGSAGRFAITEGDWKLIMPHRETKTELYNLKADPSEKKNIAAQHADVVRSLRERLTRIVATGRTTPGAPQSNDTGYWKSLTWISEQEYNRISVAE